MALRRICLTNLTKMSNPYLLLAFSTIYIPAIHYCWKLRSSYFVTSPHLSLCVKMVHKPPGVRASLELWLRFCEKWKCWSLSHVRLFATPRNIAHQAPLCMEFSRQEFWSGLPFPSPGDLPNPRIEPRSLHSRQILYYLSCETSPTHFKGS